MPLLLPVLAVLLVLAAPRAHAVELELGWNGRTAWESNVFRRSNNEEADFSVLTGPELHLRERTRALDFDLGYRLLYEEFIRLDGLGSFQHFVRGNGSWRPTVRDTLTLSQDFARTENLIQILDTGATGLVSGELVQDREPISRNYTGLEYRHQITPIWELRAAANNTAYWFDAPTRSDSLSTTGSVDVTRMLSLRQSAGIGVAVTRQDFDETEFTNGSGTSFAQLYGIWNYRFTKTIALGISAGPRWSRPDDLEDTANALETPLIGAGDGRAFVLSPSGCKAFAPGIVRQEGCAIASPVRVDPSSADVRQFDFLEEREEPGDTLSYFGRVAISKSWETLTSTLSFERSASTSSGLAASTDLNVLSLRNEWRPRRTWRVIGIASWERQISTSDLPVNELLISTTPTTVYVDSQGRIVTDPSQAAVTIPNAGRVVGLRTKELVDNGIDISSVRLELRVHHDITPRISVSGVAVWWRQQSEGELQADDVITDARVELSLTWRLAPIDL